jgi:hypothetical protein
VGPDCARTRALEGAHAKGRKNGSLALMDPSSKSGYRPPSACSNIRKAWITPCRTRYGALWILLAHQHGTDAKCAMCHGTETNAEQRAGCTASWLDTAPAHYTSRRGGGFTKTGERVTQDDERWGTGAFVAWEE